MRTVRARDQVQEIVDRFCKEHGFTKKSGSWFRIQDETIAVIDLQRSNSAHAYYVNVALWLLGLGEATAPKEHTCHVRTRLDRLVADPGRVRSALDLRTGLQSDRERIVVDALSVADGLLAACATVAGCRSVPGQRLIERSLVRGSAQRLVAG